MSFHSLSRSNNRHNFIGPDMGDIGSASPFARATAADGSGGFKSSAGKTNGKKKDGESTIIKIDDVDKSTRNSLAKEELRKKLSGRTRSSVEFQKIEKWHSHKEMSKELLPENLPRISSPSADAERSQRTYASRHEASTPVQQKHVESSGAIVDVITTKSAGFDTNTNAKKNKDDSPFTSGGGNNGEDSDDDDYGEDVYGWRFDQTKEGEEENERNLEFHGTPKLNDQGTAAKMRNHDATSQSSTSSLLQKSARDMMSSFRSGIPGQLNSFVSEEKQRKIGGALKSVASATSAGLKKIGSVVSKVTDATGKLLHELDDPKHALGEKTDSYMKIHDLNSAPTRDTAKKKRVEEINRVIEQARMFGVGDEVGHNSNGQRVKVDGSAELRPQTEGKEFNDKGLTRGLEGIITNVTMPKSRTPKPNKEQGPTWERTINKDQLFGSNHDMKFVDDGKSEISNQEYRTLFDVKDVHGYQQEYFGKDGPGMRTMTAPEAEEVLFKKKKNSVHVITGTGTRGQSYAENHSLDMASVDETGSRRSLDNEIARAKEAPRGQFIMDPLAPLAKGSSIESTGTFLKGKGIYAIQDGGNNPGMVSPSHGYHATHAGLTKRNSMNRSFTNKSSRRLAPVNTDDPKDPVTRSNDVGKDLEGGGISRGSSSKMNLLQASASFLKKEMKRASSWILPPQDDEKVHLHTKKNPVPPAATQTMGFTRAGDETMIDDDVEKNEKTPFSLLSPTGRASSFASSFRGSGGNDTRPTASPINNMRRIDTSNSLSPATAAYMKGQRRGGGVETVLPPVTISAASSRGNTSPSGDFTHDERQDSITTRPFGRAKSSSGLLSDRHYTTIRDASVGLSKPVIYTPGSSAGVGPSSLASDGSIRAKEGERTSLYSHSSYNDLNDILEDSADSESVRRIDDDPGVKNSESAYPTRILAASDVGPNLVEKNLNEVWKACWDAEAGSVYYYNTATGEASWLPPAELMTAQQDTTREDTNDGDNSDDNENDRDLFLRALNSGLPRGLSELQLGESDLTIKTRTIAARHSLYSKLRTRYEGDKETEYTAGLIAKEHREYGEKEHQEIMNELNKEVDSWIEEV